MNQNNKNNILKISLGISAIVVIVKLIGFVRQAVIAAYFGANAATDAFFFAEAMPGMIFPAVCNSISTGFISLYVLKSIKEGEKKGDLFASQTLTAAILLALTLSGIAIIFAPLLVKLLAPGFTEEILVLAIKLTRIVLSAFVITMIQYMIGAILNARKIFYVVQIAGLVGNLSIIAITVLLGEGQSVDFLTFTIIIGNILNALILFICCRNKIKLSFSKKFFSPDVKQVFLLAIPIMFGNGMIAIQGIVDKAFASGLAPGSISAISYAEMLNSFVFSIIITSLSTVLYPVLTENAAHENFIEFAYNLRQNIIYLFMILLPISIITVIFASDVVTIVYKRGDFDNHAAELTSMVLNYFALMYVFIGIREILTRAFYAVKDSKTPMINTSVGICAHIVCSVLLVPRFGIIGIPIGATVSAILASVLLTINIRKHISGLNLKALLPSALKIICASCILIIYLIYLHQFIITDIVFVRFLFVATSGFAVYFISLLLLKSSELLALKNLMKKSLLRNKKG